MRSKGPSKGARTQCSREARRSAGEKGRGVKAKARRSNEVEGGAEQ